MYRNIDFPTEHGALDLVQRADAWKQRCAMEEKINVEGQRPVQVRKKPGVFYNGQGENQSRANGLKNTSFFSSDDDASSVYSRASTRSRTGTTYTRTSRGSTHIDEATLSRISKLEKSFEVERERRERAERELDELKALITQNLGTERTVSSVKSTRRSQASSRPPLMPSANRMNQGPQGTARSMASSMTKSTARS